MNKLKKEFEEKIDSSYGDWWIEEAGEIELDDKAVWDWIETKLIPQIEARQRKQLVEEIESEDDLCCNGRKNCIYEGNEEYGHGFSRGIAKAIELINETNQIICQRNKEIGKID